MSNTNGINGKTASSSAIPASSRKIVLSLKEIVNCPELEIYSMLKECNMDPNEAVNRLLTQDPFREVKSKREKKKENKDTPESRPRGAGNTSIRGGRGGANRYAGRSSSTQSKYLEPGAIHGKPVQRKENGSHSYISSSSSYAPNLPGDMNWQSPPLSDSVSKGNKMSTADAGDKTYTSSQPSSGFQSAWGGPPGHVSMADVVKMGRGQGKASSGNPSSQVADHQHAAQRPSAATLHTSYSSQVHTSDILEVNHEPGVGVTRNFSANDEWSSVEQTQHASFPLVEKEYINPDVYADQSEFHYDRVNENHKFDTGEGQESEDGATEEYNTNHAGSSSASDRALQEETSGGASHFDNDNYENMSPYQSHMHQHREVGDGGVSLSSVSMNMQQLSLVQDEPGAPREDNNRSVVIPNHLQVQSAECSHLSFGSFGVSIGAVLSGQSSSQSVKNDMEEPSSSVDVESVGQVDTRNPEYYVDEHIRTRSDENIGHRSDVSSEAYPSHSTSQPELLKQETSETGQGNQYTFPSSMPGYAFDSSQQLNAAYAQLQAGSHNQLQNLSPFSNIMAYTNSLPSTLLASSVQQPLREPDLSYSPFPVTNTTGTKYSSASPSVSGSTISVSEALKSSNLSMPQGTPQTLPGGNIATGPILPQHLAMNPYSQPTLPLGHFANMYSFLPQSYTYMPSAFQQQFGGNSSYHQSLAAVLPQYKNSVSVSSLPQSGAVASGYGAFGNSNGGPGNFPLNPPTAPTGTSMGYDDVISSQYKDANQLLALQQNENSTMWVQGMGSRTMSAIPSNTYYGFQGQNQQQPTGYRQGQQPLQHFNYPNFYQSQAGVSMEHQQQQQQQNSRDGSVSGSQGQQSKQSQQLWQNSY